MIKCKLACSLLMRLRQDDPLYKAQKNNQVYKNLACILLVLRVFIKTQLKASTILFPLIPYIPLHQPNYLRLKEKVGRQVSRWMDTRMHEWNVCMHCHNFKKFLKLCAESKTCYTDMS